MTHALLLALCAGSAPSRPPLRCVGPAAAVSVERAQAEKSINNNHIVMLMWNEVLLRGMSNTAHLEAHLKAWALG